MQPTAACRRLQTVKSRAREYPIRQWTLALVQQGIGEVLKVRLQLWHQ
jgi:hypothetical protein